MLLSHYGQKNNDKGKIKKSGEGRILLELGVTRNYKMENVKLIRRIRKNTLHIE